MMTGGRGKHEERRGVTAMRILPPQEVGTCFFKVKSTYSRDIYVHPRLFQLGQLESDWNNWNLTGITRI